MSLENVRLTLSSNPNLLRTLLILTGTVQESLKMGTVRLFRFVVFLDSPCFFGILSTLLSLSKYFSAGDGNSINKEFSIKGGKKGFK